MIRHFYKKNLIFSTVSRSFAEEKKSLTKQESKKMLETKIEEYFKNSTNPDKLRTQFISRNFLKRGPRLRLHFEQEEQNEVLLYEKTDSLTNPEENRKVAKMLLFSTVVLDFMFCLSPNIVFHPRMAGYFLFYLSNLVCFSYLGALSFKRKSEVVRLECNLASRTANFVLLDKFKGEIEYSVGFEQLSYYPSASFGISKALLIDTYSGQRFEFKDTDAFNNQIVFEKLFGSVK